jgi:hypothetical protein
MKKAIALEEWKTDPREVSKKSATLTSANDEGNKGLVSKYKIDYGNAQNRNCYTYKLIVKPVPRSNSHPRIDFGKLGIKYIFIHSGQGNHSMKDCNTYRNSLKCSAYRWSRHDNKCAFSH